MGTAVTSSILLAPASVVAKCLSGMTVADAKAQAKFASNATAQGQPLAVPHATNAKSCLAKAKTVPRAMGLGTGSQKGLSLKGRGTAPLNAYLTIKSSSQSRRHPLTLTGLTLSWSPAVVSWP